MALPSSGFSPLSKAGLVGSWSTHQVIIVAIGVAGILIPMINHQSPFSIASLFFLILIVVSLINVKGRSLWELLLIRLGFGLRQATGQTRWTVSPMAMNSTVGLIDLPGTVGQRLKPLRMVDTEFGGGAFLHDETTGEVTVVLRLMAAPFLFTSEDEKTGRAAGFTRLIEGIAELDGVSRITTQARSLYWPHTPSVVSDEVPVFAAQDLEDMEADQLAAVMGHDMILTVSVNTEKVTAEIKAHGGGAAGISHVLKDRLLRIVDMVRRAGADSSDIVWQDAAMIRGLMKTLVDPSAHRLLNKRLELADTIPVATAFAEYATEIQVDGMWARTLWVDNWPSDEVVVGFLKDFIAQHHSQLILTQAWRGLGERQARKQLDNRLAELERIERKDKALGRPTDRKVYREIDEVESRLKEVAASGADAAFQGFITLLAPSKTELDTLTRAVRAQASGFLHFDPLRSQQWAGWLTALPLGQAGR